MINKQMMAIELLNNKNFFKEYILKLKRNMEWRMEFSIKMKRDNPVKKAEVRKKISEALKNKPKGKFFRSYVKRVKIKCEICKKKFIRRITETKRFCSRKCVDIWQRKYRIYNYIPTEETKRKISEAVKKDPPSKRPEVRKRIADTLKGKYTKEKSGNWKGGISNKPYSFDFKYELKEKIRIRDKYVCQICGKKQKKKKLFVHHIDYDKMNSEENNLISLCNSCHSKTNHKRKYWIKFFEDLMKRIKK